MAALSPAHFLLWARLTTASPAPSVTPKRRERIAERVWVSPPAHAPGTSLICQPPHPPQPFSRTISEHMSVSVCVHVRLCVCVCVIPALCVWGLAQLAGSLSLSLPLFLPVSITLLLYPSASPSIPPSLPPPSLPPRCLDGGH